MEIITTEETKTITTYKTKDGRTFDNKSKAEIHEKLLILAEKMQQIKYVDGAYYCETQEDFDVIVDYKAHMNPSWHHYSDEFKPNYEYKKSSFIGPDWYFFHREYCRNDIDKCWVDTLSRKKEEWENFYNQFTLEN